MLDDNNGARYWPDNYPNSEDSTNANKMTHQKTNVMNELYLRGFGAVLQPVAPAPGEVPGPEKRPVPRIEQISNFTLAAKEEDTEGLGISSVPPLIADGIGQRSSVQQDNTPDQGGQSDGAELNNATDDISPPDQNSRLRSTEGNEPNGNIPRRGNVTRRHMPPNKRRRPRNDGYVSERTLEECMMFSTSSESDPDSDTQSEQMNNGTENMEEGPLESTIVANEQAGLAPGMPTDDGNIEEIAADIWNEHLGQHDTDIGPGPEEMPNAQTNNSNDANEAGESPATPGQAPPVTELLREPLQANESREPDD
uniref:Uncharacterized protein n=1 Tax=Bionectria ochroleuca TaxID=29856 RepID=A0A8H7NEH7_BIOOC